MSAMICSRSSLALGVGWFELVVLVGTVWTSLVCFWLGVGVLVSAGYSFSLKLNDHLVGG